MGSKSESGREGEAEARQDSSQAIPPHPSRAGAKLPRPSACLPSLPRRPPPPQLRPGLLAKWPLPGPMGWGLGALWSQPGRANTTG